MENGVIGISEHSTRPIAFVLSDSIGETAEQVTRAAAAQFNAGHIEIRRVPHVHDREAIVEVIEEAKGLKSIIVFTLIVPELRMFLLEEAHRHSILTVDIMGPMMAALGSLTYIEPKLQPGLMHRMDEEYFRRVEAVEFAVKYDDGKDPRGLLLAEVVLIGVSRTSKTPVSLYLAQRRHKVANVPLVPELPPPEELFSMPRNKVVGLTIKAESLIKIRQERLKTMGLGASASYAGTDRILRETAYAQEVFDRLRCPVVDVTDRAIEETANRVLEITSIRRETQGA